MYPSKGAKSRDSATSSGKVPVVLLELRAATASIHQRLERRLPLGAHDLSWADYESIIRAYCGFYRPLEGRLDPVARLVPDLEWQQRQKTHVLERDLLKLGLDRQAVEALPNCQALPAISGVGDALGCLYVVEGATLGGQILRRLVWERLGIAASSGGAFLDVYGAATGVMWRRFQRCLGALEEPALRNDAVEAAVATFSSLESWLDAHGVLR